VIRFLAGVVVGSLGATYIVSALLPVTREEKPRDPLPGRRGVTVEHWDEPTPEDFERMHRLLTSHLGASDDTWTSGPIT
jgi:hypothetical protein